MRISDWSSDVCSSDLPRTSPGLPPDLDSSAMHRLGDGRLVLGSVSERTWIEAGGRWHELGPQQGMPSNTPFFFTEHGGYLYAAGIRGVARVPLADLPRDARDARVRGEMLLNERGDPNAGQRGVCCNGAGLSKGRSEEHTSELQSLMRISSAVFCLKKKKQHTAAGEIGREKHWRPVTKQQV